MTDPIVFETATARLGLPLLFSGQSQKEVLVNESLIAVDALLHGAVEARTAVPPTDPADGEAWIVGTGASGAWAGKDGDIAYRHSGQWLFIPARDGMRLWHRTARQDWRYVEGEWFAPAAPDAPTGGATVDIEARAVLVNLLQTLHSAGLFA